MHWWARWFPLRLPLVAEKLCLQKQFRSLKLISLFLWKNAEARVEAVKNYSPVRRWNWAGGKACCQVVKTIVELFLSFCSGFIAMEICFINSRFMLFKNTPSAGTWNNSSLHFHPRFWACFFRSHDTYREEKTKKNWEKQISSQIESIKAKIPAREFLNNF